MSKVRFNKKTRELRDMAKALGYSVEHTSGTHLKFTHPDVEMPIFSSSTPNGTCGAKNCLSMLKRALKNRAIPDSITPVINGLEGHNESINGTYIEDKTHARR